MNQQRRFAVIRTVVYLNIVSYKDGADNVISVELRVFKECV